MPVVTTGAIAAVAASNAASASARHQREAAQSAAQYLKSTYKIEAVISCRTAGYSSDVITKCYSRDSSREENAITFSEYAARYAAGYKVDSMFYDRYNGYMTFYISKDTNQ